MTFSDFHLHTSFSDGKNSPEEMVRAALQMGMGQIGFSDHSFTSFDASYGMPKQSYAAYKQTISDLKEKYKGQIEIFCGIEQDVFSPTPTESFDYIIGSVHYVKAGEDYIPVDLDADTIRNGVEKHFDGDFLAFAEAYFALEETVVEKTNADIIGHFDLLTKFEEKTSLFDTSHPRYINAWQKAVDKLLPYNKVFEINTGAISRGYRTTPYPAKDILSYIADRGGKFILSGDAHSAEGLCFQFEKWKTLF